MGVCQQLDPYRTLTSCIVKFEDFIFVQFLFLLLELVKLLPQPHAVLGFNLARKAVVCEKVRSLHVLALDVIKQRLAKPELKKVLKCCPVDLR